MITARLQIVAIIAVLLLIIMLIGLLKKNRLALRYSLLWMLSCLVMLILALFPGLLDDFAHLIGVYSSVNALFAVLICCGLMLMISFTVIVSKEKREIVKLVQENALMEQRIRKLEEKINEKATE